MSGFQCCAALRALAAVAKNRWFRESKDFIEWAACRRGKGWTEELFALSPSEQSDKNDEIATLRAGHGRVRSSTFTPW